MVKNGLFGGALLTTALIAGLAHAAEGGSCGANYWPGTLPEHEVDTVSAAELKAYLDSTPIIDGIEFDVSYRGGEIWLDIVRYPGDVTMLASIRSMFVIGRVVRPEYEKLVLANDGKGLFEISYKSLHAIGCQFVWGIEGKGQNPIALNRELADALRFYGTGERVASPFNGSLMGDTSKMLSTFNDVIYPQWVLKTVTID